MSLFESLKFTGQMHGGANYKRVNVFFHDTNAQHMHVAAGEMCGRVQGRKEYRPRLRSLLVIAAPWRCLACVEIIALKAGAMRIQRTADDAPAVGGPAGKGLHLEQKYPAGVSLQW